MCFDPVGAAEWPWLAYSGGIVDVDVARVGGKHLSGGSLDRVWKVDAHGLKKYEMCSVSIVGVLEHPLAAPSSVEDR